MKKMTSVLIVLLAAVLIAVSVLPVGMPGGELVPGVAELSAGSVAVAENRRYSSRIYILRDEAVSEIYREVRIAEEQYSSILRVSGWNGRLFFLRGLDGTNGWSLMRLENGQAEQVARGTFEEEMTVTGMTAHEDRVWITGVLHDGGIAVYECTGGGAVRRILTTPAWWLQDVAQAEYDGTVIRAVTKHGELCQVTDEGVVVYLDETKRDETVTLGTGPAWILYKGQALVAAALVWMFVAVSVLVAMDRSRKAERVAARLTFAGGEVLLLTLAAAVTAAFVIVEREAGLVQAVRAGKAAGVAAIAIWLAGTVLLRLVAGSATAEIAAMTRQMADVADGNVKPRELRPGKDELSRMNLAMQEMCMGLSIRDYEMNATIGSYKRFVPNTLTQLLDRASVAEVDLGDSRRMVGNVGLFSIGNRAEVRSMLDDDAFVEFINRTFGVFHDCVLENNGSMVSCSLRLSGMETIFPGNGADGVRAGLDFLGRLGKVAGGGIPAPQPMMILHKASLLYGVAGKRERLFPYLSSAELEFLERFSGKFHESGTRLVMTEEYWSDIKNAGFAVRYIGFVSDGEKNAYKLYEVLDVYPELERKLRVEYDQRFQEAIDLFYHNDFFLARNLFSTLLRVCPGDGIVRWYLFACEHCFNHAGEAEVDYRLFGIEEA